MEDPIRDSRCLWAEALRHWGRSRDSDHLQVTEPRLHDHILCSRTGRTHHSFHCRLYRSHCAFLRYQCCHLVHARTHHRGKVQLLSGQRCAPGIIPRCRWVGHQILKVIVRGTAMIARALKKYGCRGSTTFDRSLVKLFRSFFDYEFSSLFERGADQCTKDSWACTCSCFRFAGARDSTTLCIERMLRDRLPQSQTIKITLLRHSQFHNLWSDRQCCQSIEETSTFKSEVTAFDADLLACGVGRGREMLGTNPSPIASSALLPNSICASTMDDCSDRPDSVASHHTRRS